jgi:hypothetical protein
MVIYKKCGERGNDERGKNMYRYKYNPKDYENMIFLPDDIGEYYSVLEAYKKDKTNTNEALFSNKREDLCFSIKHRVVEGCLTEYQAQEMRDYFNELYYLR